MKIIKPFTLIISCLLSLFSFAQDWSGKTYKYYDIYPGYVITLKGDTITGYIEHGNRISNQKQCVYYADASKKNRKEYKPSDLKGYSVSDKVYRSVHFSGGLTAKPLSFVLVAKPGHITQYWYYSKKDDVAAIKMGNESDADYDVRVNKDENVWQKGDENPFQQSDLVLGFAKKMNKLVSEYSELAKKVEDKEKGYGLTNIYNIIEEYNKWWESNKK